MKSKIKIVIFAFIAHVLIIIMGITLWISVSLAYFYYSVSTQFIAKDFNKYKDDFNKVVEYVIDYQDNVELPKNDWFIVVDSSDIKTIDLSYNRTRLNVPDDIKQALWNTQKAFARTKQKEYSHIRCYENEVHFYKTETAPYCLVYTINGKKPQTQIGNNNFKLKKINKHWYHLY
ncbi:hypothetical protein LJB90_00900 [Eubacteriales bacterium OttesenSCG-928-G02]|nr:hypothetical protein [Eubacteriales bacterium OttesenSCG-928-G02]